MIRRRRRGQVLPFFILFLLFVLPPLFALLIDGAGLISAQREASALTWRGAKFAAADVALSCGQTGSTITVGKNCVYGPDGAARLGAASGRVGSYLGYWLEGGPEEIGLAFQRVSRSSVTPEGPDALRVTIGVCYRAIFFTFPDSMAGGCNRGDLEIVSSETAAVLISN